MKTTGMYRYLEIPIATAVTVGIIAGWGGYHWGVAVGYLAGYARGRVAGIDAVWNDQQAAQLRDFCAHYCDPWLDDKFRECLAPDPPC